MSVTLGEHLWDFIYGTTKQSFLFDLKYHEFRFKLWYKEEESLIALILVTQK